MMKNMNNKTHYSYAHQVLFLYCVGYETKKKKIVVNSGNVKNGTKSLAAAVLP